MRFLERGRDAAVEAILAGALVASVEAARVAGTVHSDAHTFVVIAALGAIASFVVAAGMRAGVALIVRAPLIQSWVRDLTEGGERRQIAIWRGVVFAGAIAMFAASSYTLGVRALPRITVPGASGIVLAYTACFVGVVVAYAAVLVERSIVMRLREPEHPRRGTAAMQVVTRMFDRRGAWIMATALVLVLALAPMFDLGAGRSVRLLARVMTASSIAIALLLARAWRLGRIRAAQVACIPIVLASALGIHSLASAAHARRAIVDHGVASAASLDLIWALADRDGDGYPGALVGGADCDDHDPARHPNAADVPGNHVDENCTGADAVAVPARLHERIPDHDRRPLNVVLISVDTLRADRLGAWGYPAAATPRLDRFAARAVRFSWALTSTPWTRLAIPSLMTGRFASTLDAAAEHTPVPTLASTLRDGGWETAAITGCDRTVLGAGDTLGEFDWIDGAALHWKPKTWDAAAIADSAIGWLQARGSGAKPFLLWLHFYDVHYPHTGRTYDEEVALVDTNIGRVLDTLDALGEADRTIVIVTADHGEQFGEHGLEFHGNSLYNQLIRIPLLVAVPGAPPRVVDTPVSITDVMPTIVALVGVPGPAGMNGESLERVFDGEPPAARPVLSELVPDGINRHDMAAVIAAPWKVIWDREANAWALFRLDDANDASDLADREPETLARMQRVLLDALDRELAVLPRVTAGSRTSSVR